MHNKIEKRADSAPFCFMVNAVKDRSCEMCLEKASDAFRKECSRTKDA